MRVLQFKRFTSKEREEKERLGETERQRGRQREGK